MRRCFLVTYALEQVNFLSICVSIYLSLPVVVDTGCTGGGLSVPGGGSGALTRPHPLVFRPEAFYLLLEPLVVLFQQLFASHLQF